MIRTTPFHERTSALNETGLWEHWAGTLAAQKYQLSEKFEYFAVRNAAGLFDTSPLFKYRFTGPGAERFLAGILARDPRSMKPGEAQYTIWCDDRGFLVEDGVMLRHADDDFVLTAAEPNFAWFADQVGPRDDVVIEDVSDDWAVLSHPGPAREVPARRPRQGHREARLLRAPRAKIGGKQVRVSRTGYTGDLGYEVWCRPEDALAVWDAIWESTRGYGVLPFGMQALYMTRIEAGLLLLDVDFASSRFAWTDADRATPAELGLAWMLRGIEGTDRVFIGRDAIRQRARREAVALPDHRHRRGLPHWNRLHDEAGLIPPMDHTPVRRRCSCTTTRASRSGSRRASCTRRSCSGTSGSPGSRSRSAAPGSPGQPRDPDQPPLRPRRRADRAAAPLQPAAEDGVTMAKTARTDKARPHLDASSSAPATTA